MDTQNTPVHVRLWHKGFWLLAFADLLLTMSVYMLVMVMPDWLGGTMGLDGWQTGLVMGAYGLGLFVLGPYCSYLVQHYRRNQVCILSILLMAAVILGIFVCQQKYVAWHLGAWTFAVLRFVLGAAFGLAQMVLSSTLIIDTSESFQRTEANHSAAWFARFALSLGPVLAMVLGKVVNMQVMYLVIAGLALLAIVLIRMVSFPFRAPEEQPHTACLDRFFLPEGWLLFLNLILVTAVMGMLFSTVRSTVFYGMMMCGFFLALLAERFAFANADLKSETITGLLLIGAAMLVMQTAVGGVGSYLPPVMVGFGIGIIGSRFLLFFIKLSRHCQRGTSQSTFFLAWELGISLGLFMGYAFLRDYIYTAGVGLVVVSLLLYNFFTHPWYMKHKNR